MKHPSETLLDPSADPLDGVHGMHSAYQKQLLPLLEEQLNLHRGGIPAGIYPSVYTGPSGGPWPTQGPPVQGKI